MKPPINSQPNVKEPDWTYVIQAVLYTGEMSLGSTHKLYSRIYNDLYKWLRATGRI